MTDSRQTAPTPTSCAMDAQFVATQPHELKPQGMVPPRKNCLHLRGLPYDAQVETIAKFLGLHAFAIVNHGVHMVYDGFGQPSGEAFVRMDSEESASLAARHCHGRYIKEKGQTRYIEVLQCSMNDVPDPSVSAGSPPPASRGQGGARRVPVLPLTALTMPPPPPLPSSPTLPPVALSPYPSPPMSPVTHDPNMGVVMVLLRDLPLSASPHYILALLRGFPELTPDCVNIQRGADGRPNGKAIVVFPRQVEAGRVLEELHRRNVSIDLLVAA